MTDRPDNSARDMTIGAAVVGTSGRLGEVYRVVVDANLNRVTNIVVRHDRLLGHDERLIPMKHVERIERGVVYLSMDTRDFEAMDPFVEEQFRAPDAGFAGPLGLDRGQYVLDTFVAEGPMGALSTPPPSFGSMPHGQTAADDPRQTALTGGMDVLDANGDKVGEVHELTVAADTGQPTRLILRRGWLLKHATEIPVQWVDDVSDGGIVLNVPASRVEDLERGETETPPS